MGLLSFFTLFLPFILAFLSPKKELNPPQETHAAKVEFVEKTPITFIKKTASKTPRVSKGEKLCRLIVHKILEERKLVANVLYNHRPDFLCNPETKRNLELDIFVDVIRPFPHQFAIEFNGKQHDQFVAKYHKTKRDFEKQQYRDGLKFEICRERKINLIVISQDEYDKYDDPVKRFNSIKSIIEKSLAV